MHQLIGIIDSEFVDHILANETQEDPSDETLFRSRGHDSPISERVQGSPIYVDEKWLAQHGDMRSPGTIALHRDRLGRHFWACVHKLNGNLDTRTDPALRRQLCQSMVSMVLAHERFHHFCDVIGRITGYRGGESGKRNLTPEEALATAWEWQHAQRNFASMPGFPEKLQEAWIDWWFDAISSKGYEDWKKFSHSCFFREGLATHLVGESTNDLLGRNGCDLGDWLHGQLENCAWMDAAVSYWKATDANENPGEGIKIEATCTQTHELSRPPKWIEVTSRFCHEGRTDLKDIHKANIASILASDFSNHDGKICLNGNPIKSHILGLLIISATNMQIEFCGLRDPLLKAVKIINKHIGKGRGGLIDAQNELIDAGLEEFAQL